MGVASFPSVAATLLLASTLLSLFKHQASATPVQQKRIISSAAFYDYCIDHFYFKDQEKSQYSVTDMTFQDCADSCSSSDECATFEVDIDHSGAASFSSCYLYNVHPPVADLDYIPTTTEELATYFKRSDPLLPAQPGLPASCVEVACTSDGCLSPSTPTIYYERAKRRLAAEQRRFAALSPCPGTEDACFFSSGGSNFECFDYARDLRSCGGCVHAQEGIDCLSLPGVVGVGCQDGVCVASSCLAGYRLVDDACVRI